VFVWWLLGLALLGEARAGARQSQRSDEKERFEELARELHERWPDRRQRAIKKLAALGTREAWELVLRGLADAAPEVADEARVQLAASREPAVVEALFGESGLESRDEWVRVRAAETLGRSMGEVEAQDLSRAIDVRDAAVARALVGALERRARASRVPEPERVLREVEACSRHGLDALLRGAALGALAVLAPERELASIEEACEDRVAEVRCAALRALAEIRGEGSLDRVRELAGDPSSGVRALAIDLYERFASKASLVALIERLEHEERPALRWRAVQALQRMTGRKERLDPRPWRVYAATLAEDWRPGARCEPSEAGSGTFALAGLPILSDRVAFLIDFSGSLWRVDENGRSRKAIVDEKMRAALEALPETAQFNVIPYTNEPHPWREALVPATRANIERGARDFETCQERGKGNFFDAALLALADPGVDTIVVLTDGAPTGGHRFQLELLFEALLEENRGRWVTFDSIVVDCPKGVARRWLEFSQRTGGRSIAVALE
jgi:HEAT repeat protein